MVDVKEILTKIESVLISLSEIVKPSNDGTNLSEMFKTADGVEITFDPAFEVGAKVSFNGFDGGDVSVILEDGRTVEIVGGIVTAILDAQPQNVQMSEEIKIVFSKLEERLKKLETDLSKKEDEVLKLSEQIKQGLSLSAEGIKALNLSLEEVKKTPLSEPTEPVNFKKQNLELLTQKR